MNGTWSIPQAKAYKLILEASSVGSEWKENLWKRLQARRNDFSFHEEIQDELNKFNKFGENSRDIALFGIER